MAKSLQWSTLLSDAGSIPGASMFKISAIKKNPSQVGMVECSCQFIYSHLFNLDCWFKCLMANIFRVALSMDNTSSYSYDLAIAKIGLDLIFISNYI